MVEAQKKDYTLPSLQVEGFIHCSKKSQVLRVANLYYNNRNDLILLSIDPERLEREVRWEAGTDKADELFPHVYGPINLDAIEEVLALKPEADGTFRIPFS
jgi:uncharacterized protein (DUF952 family)